ncbi:MAG: hypothetical protein AB7K24_01480 [Gemmataceae bacterium]
MLRFSFLKRCLPVAVLLFAAGCVGGQPRITDNGGVFQPATKQEALKDLNSINREYKSYVVIDTFKKIPFYKDMLRKVPKMTEEKRAEFFQNWARKRLPGSSAIYVLVYDGEPEKHVEVAVGRDLNKAFTPADRQDLARIFSQGLQSENPGPALLEGIKVIQERLHTNLGGPVTPKPFDWIGFGVIVLVLGGIWLAVALVNIVTTSNYRTAFAGINLAGYGLGGGYSSLLTALFTARNRVDAVPPPPPPPFEEKPFPDEPEPVAEESSSTNGSDTEAATSSLHEDAASAPAETDSGDEAPRA